MSPAYRQTRDRAFAPCRRTPHAGYLILRLRSYPAWQGDGQWPGHASLPRRDDGLIAVPVPQGAVDLTVDWTHDPAMSVAGRWLSALALRVLLAGASLLRDEAIGDAAGSFIMRAMPSRREIADPGGRGADRPGARGADSQRRDRAGVDSRRHAPLDLCRRQAPAAGAGHAGRGHHCRRAARRESSGWARPSRCCTPTR